MIEQHQAKQSTLNQLQNAKLNRNWDLERKQMFATDQKNQYSILPVIILPLFSLSIKIEENQKNLEAKGTFCYLNGNPIYVGKFFSSFQQNVALPTGFKINGNSKVLQFSQKFQKNNSDESNAKIFQSLLDTISSNISQLKKFFTIIGINKQCSKTSKKMLRLKLETNKKLLQIINHRASDCCAQQLNTDKIPKKQHYLSCLKQVESINFKKQDLSRHLNHNEQNNVSQSSSFCKLNTKVTEKNGSASTKNLGLKYVYSGNQQSKEVQKIQYEKRILSQISESPYILKYYTQKCDETKQKSGQFLWMEHINQSLNDKLKNNSLSITQKIDIMRQVTTGVRKLHQQGIVHRDLKPSNILIKQEIIQEESSSCLGLYGSGISIQTNENQHSKKQIKKFSVKIIDFGESIQCWKLLDKTVFQENKFEKIGATLPYSPIQCSVLCPQGYSKLKIDNWSIGMLLSQLMLNRLPVCYTKCQKQNIRTGWVKSDFTFLMDLRINKTTDFVAFAAKVIALHLMKFKYEERLCLKAVEEALTYLSEFNFNYFMQQ